MSEGAERPSARRDQLLDLAYRYVLDHGLTDLSLRPLAAEIGSSPRVLLYLFGSKEGLVKALLETAREHEVCALEAAAGEHAGRLDLAATVRTVWAWLAEPSHRPVLRLWVQAYARSLTEPDGLWGGFAERTVADWTALLARAQPVSRRRTRAGTVERTLALAVLRGALLDLLATQDQARAGAAVEAYLAGLDSDLSPART
jgi:AcrR family transcriptional regulator